MASVNEIRCPACQKTYLRTVKQVNQVVKRSGVWRCKSCVLTERNKRNARPIGSVRMHKSTGYIDEKTEHGWQRQHIAVMERHIGRRLRAGEVVHHKNETKQDNRLENLELMQNGEHTAHHHTGMTRTPEQRRNIRDAIRASSTARLTVSDALLIRRISRKQDLTQASIAKHFGVSTMTVNRVINNKTWN